MQETIIASYLVYSLVTAYTPGPNNVVALHAVSRFGWSTGRKVLLGMTVGFFIVMLICGLSCYLLAGFIPSLVEILKYIGAAYIAWLGVHIMRSSPSESSAKNFSFWSGFCLQFVNVKIILYAVTIYTAYVIPKSFSPESLFFHALVISCIGISGFWTWAEMGKVFQKFLQKYFLPFNVAMGLILIYCAVQLLLD